MVVIMAPFLSFFICNKWLHFGNISDSCHTWSVTLSLKYISLWQIIQSLSYHLHLTNYYLKAKPEDITSWNKFEISQFEVFVLLNAILVMETKNNSWNGGCGGYRNNSLFLIHKPQAFSENHGTKLSFHQAVCLALCFMCFMIMSSQNYFSCSFVSLWLTQFLCSNP